MGWGGGGWGHTIHMQVTELRDARFFMLEDEAAYKFSLKKSMFWQVCDPETNLGYGSGSKSGNGILIAIRIRNLSSKYI